MKKFYIIAIFVALVCGGFWLIGQKYYDVKLSGNHQIANVTDTDFGLFLASQHALYVNDFDSASKMVNNIKTNNTLIGQARHISEFFNGKMPADADKLKKSKDLVGGLIYDAFLIHNDDWKSVYARHNKDVTIFAAPLRIFAGVKQGKIKEVNKFIDSLKLNDSWKAFLRGQIAVLKNDIDGAAKEFAKVHPDFMNINDYLYLMSFYRENDMLEDMEILRNDFLAKPGGMYVLNFPDIPDWSNYAGYQNNVAFSLVQNISHMQIMIYTDLSLMFLRFAQLISNGTNTDAVNYYLGQYYFHNNGNYKKCFDAISNTSPFYLFGRLIAAERNNDIGAIKKMVRANPLFVPGIQIVVRNHVKYGNKRAALRVLNKALDQKGLPETGRVLFLKQRANVYLMFGDAKRADKDIAELKVLSGGVSPDVLWLQANLWFVQKTNMDNAYDYAMTLIKKNTSDVRAWDLVGQIVAHKEGIDSAIELMESVTAASAGGISVLYEHLGDLYTQKKDKEKALRAYTQALELSDDGFVIVPRLKKKIRKLR